ncbi:MAG: beta-lactamase family protein [Clostridia bacterium]|nr:beta-lactamase family protein [Clostridia bacterium]
MPTTEMKNLLYRAALPLLSPSPRGQMTHVSAGQPLTQLHDYEKLLCRHHVLGATLLLEDGDRRASLHTSVSRPAHHAAENTIYRVASITKMATALVTLSCIADGLFTLDTPVRPLLPDTAHASVLDGVTVRHLLSHTSGLTDTAAMDAALREGRSYDDVLADPDIRACKPGEQLIYTNFGFGLLGCLLENATGMCLPELFRARLFAPLGMRATLDASSLDEGKIMPISRVLPYKRGHDVTITRLARKPLIEADPLRHFGHTAGAMYTDAPSLTKLLKLIHSRGLHDGRPLIPAALMDEMTRQQSATPTRRYGLGLVLLERPKLWPRRLLGHQGFAYGCVDGAFIEEETGRLVVFLNGGASEAREGRLGLVNRDVLHWALAKEMPSWT